MSRSNYSYQIGEYCSRKIIIIEDDSRGKDLSVTNNMENVIEEICRENKIKPDEYMIAYQDSFGKWDGFDWQKKDFILLNQRYWQSAIVIMMHKQKKATAAENSFCS